MNYFVIINGGQQGPYSVEQLRGLQLSSDTLVWAEGMPQWVPAWQVEELKAIIYQRQQAGTPPPPPPPVDAADLSAAQAAPESVGAQASRRRSRGGWWWAAGVLVVLMIVMAITNPSRNEHRAVIEQRLSGGISRAISGGDNSLLGQGMGMFGQMLAGPLVDGILDELLVYHNYLLFSTTTIDFGEGQSKSTSYGFFGKVFTADEQAVASAISSAVGKGLLGEGSTGHGLWDGGNAGADPDNATEDPSSVGEDGKDSIALGTKVGHAIIDHVGAAVKRELAESTDSATSSGIGKLIDDIVGLLKGSDDK